MPKAHLYKFCLTLLLVFGLFSCVGCGSAPKGPTLKGTVVLPPNVKLEENDSASVVFVPDGTEGELFAASINPSDLSFSTKGSPGKGIVPGKYKVTVNLQPYVPGESKQKQIFDTINTRYDTANSRLMYQVTSEPEQSITIDLNKGTVTRQ